MTIEEQVAELAKKHGDNLEPLRDAIKELGCMSIVFWGRGDTYEIEFKHEEKEYRITK